MPPNRIVLAIVLVSVLWAGIGFAMFHGQSELAYSASKAFCVATSFVWPAMFGVLAMQIAPKSDIRTNAGTMLTCLLMTLAALSYFVALEVVARMTEIVWRNQKFGDPSVSLGLAAAQFFVVLVVVQIAFTSFLTSKAIAGSLANRAGFASIGMSVGACLAYLALGLSPFASWRS